MKTIGFFPAHPCQLWMMRALADALKDDANAFWVLRAKDMLVPLADAMNMRYTVVSEAGTGLISNFTELLGNITRLLPITRRNHIDLWFSLYGAANLVARLTGRMSLSFNDDDYSVVPLLAHTSYPFAHAVLVTQWTGMGPYEKKAVRYRGFQELFYLHPNRFKPDPAVLARLGLEQNQAYIVIRLSALTAHHDVGIKGISEQVISQLIKATRESYRIFISSEKPLAGELAQYQLRLDVVDIHHALAYASLVFADSQTMIAEAAVLGTPAVRLNDFVGRIGYLQALEDYGLAYGFKPGQEQAALDKILELLSSIDTRERHASARNRMLEDTIDPIPFIADYFRKSLTA